MAKEEGLLNVLGIRYCINETIQQIHWTTEIQYKSGHSGPNNTLQSKKNTARTIKSKGIHMIMYREHLNDEILL